MALKPTGARMWIDGVEVTGHILSHTFKQDRGMFEYTLEGSSTKQVLDAGYNSDHMTIRGLFDDSISQLAKRTNPSYLIYAPYPKSGRPVIFWEGATMTSHEHRHGEGMQEVTLEIRSNQTFAQGGFIVWQGSKTDGQTNATFNLADSTAVDLAKQRTSVKGARLVHIVNSYDPESNVSGCHLKMAHSSAKNSGYSYVSSSKLAPSSTATSLGTSQVLSTVYSYVDTTAAGITIKRYIDVRADVGKVASTTDNHDVTIDGLGFLVLDPTSLNGLT